MSLSLKLDRFQTFNFLCKESIIIQDHHWRQWVPNLQQLLYHIYMVLPFAEKTTLCFANDQRVKKLNYQFRNKNKATNVLTFEHPDPQTPSGDIIFALQTIKHEAHHQNKPISNHVAHLIIHGLLHLQGYDHINCNEAKEMEMREAKFLQQIGIPNPWKHQIIRRI